MSNFAKTILSAFGAAAKDVAPEEMEQMVDTAAAALEAAPADRAQEAEPADDRMVEHAPEGDDLEEKLDRILSLLEGMVKKHDVEEEKRPLSDESDLDAMIETLAGKEKPVDQEAAVTVPAEEMEDVCGNPAAKDAAILLLKKVRPAVAAIQDPNERAHVTDALLSAMKGPDVMGDIMKATQTSAMKAADAHRTYDDICKEQKEAYDARNPHKNKEVVK